MYSIYIKAPRESPDSILIYSDLTQEDEYFLIDPQLTTEDNAAGSLEFELPINNIGYSHITPYGEEIDVFVYKYGYSNTYGLDGTDDVYWAGRIASVEKGIENHKNVYCEGALSFLCDTIQTPNKYTTTSSRLDNYVYHLLQRHNRKVPDNRKVYLGLVNIEYEPTDWFTNYETTMEVLENLASAANGHMRVRRSIREGHSAWVLDILSDEIWFPEYDNETGEITNADDKWMYNWVFNEDQDIHYGDNMTDITHVSDIANIVTVVYPLGKRKDKSSETELDEYYTIDGNIHLNKLPANIRDYVSVEQDYEGYWYLISTMGKPIIGGNPNPNYIGRYETTVNYDDVQNADELMILGASVLTFPNNISYEVEASAIDKSYSNRSLKAIETHDYIRVVAEPHEILEGMKVSKSVIPLAEPFNGNFTIGNTAIGTFTDFSTRNTRNVASELRYLSVTQYEPDPPDPDPEELEEE